MTRPLPTSAIHVAAGNKVHLEMKGTLLGNEVNVLSVTNGDSIYEKSGDKVGDKPDRPRKSKAVLNEIARFGAARTVADLLRFDPDKDWVVKTFKLGGKEMVAKREAHLVHYEVESRGDKPSKDAVSVWIDTKTQLPVKHSIVEKGCRFTATYKVFTLGSNLDAKLFDIPAK